MRWSSLQVVRNLKTSRLIAMFGWLAGSSFAFAQSQIDWFVRDWPPVNITQGPEQGQGAYDVMLNMLTAGLPQYRHTLHLSTLTMRQQMMQQQIPHCLFGLLKTAQRQTFLRFSDPIAAIPNLHVVALADHPLWQSLAQHNSASVVALSQQKWRGLAEQGRTYPVPLDRLSQDFLLVTATDTPLLQLLQAGRADYLLEYPDRVHYLARQQPALRIRSLPVSELPALAEIYVACSLTEASKQQIGDINQRLNELRQTDSFRQALLQRLSPSSQQLIEGYMRDSVWFDGKPAR